MKVMVKSKLMIHHKSDYEEAAPACQASARRRTEGKKSRPVAQSLFPSEVDAISPDLIASTKFVWSCSARLA
jgi:hypothetical protein